MSEPTKDFVEAVKGMGITHDEEQIQEALRRCNNNPQEAVQLLLPKSPPDSNLLSTCANISSGVSTSIGFPLTHFYELQGRVHTDSWSIPFKKDESLAICMVAAIKMIREGEESSERGGRR